MSIRSISPLDGRYASQVEALSEYMSEWALIKYRLHVEVEWLITLSARPEVTELRAFTNDESALLRSLVEKFDDDAALRVKEIERTTQHDVKAVEYYLRECLEDTSLISAGVKAGMDAREYIHFGCTSEDINNIAYSLMLRGAMETQWLPQARKLTEAVAALADSTADTALLARTHGQPATPSTLGKELAVFVHRWRRQLGQIEGAEYLAKFNGAVGAYNAHVAAYPDAPWEEIARTFVEGMGLAFNPLTTQIEPHDYLAELFHALVRFDTVAVDFDRDMWSYISLGYFRQKAAAGEVGSSTMPHKVNPIQFENSEANLGLGSALLEHLAGKLPTSRLQRDLTDSSSIRNMGPAIAHSLIGLRSALKGLGQVEVDEATLRADLDEAWEVLAEAVQTVMRKHGLPEAYDRMRDATRGKGITREAMMEFIEGLEIPDDDKKRLLTLTPASYTGLASRLVRHVSGGG